MAKRAYVGVEDKARKIKKMYVGSNAVARKIKKGYVGVDGVARQFFSSADPVFANNTWEEIIAECEGGTVPETWLVGDQKPILINGVEYNIDIIGKYHDNYADGSGKAPLTLQLHELYATAYPMHTSQSNKSGWTGCAMRTTHLPSFLALMPSEVQAGIKEVNKLTSAGNMSSTIVTTADKLFLLSVRESTGETTYSKPGEGSRYAYYSQGFSSTKYKKGGSTSRGTPWWTRSPRNSTSTEYCYINGSGKENRGTADNEECIAPAFCF